jgi:hypothetical protein
MSIPIDHTTLIVTTLTVTLAMTVRAWYRHRETVAREAARTDRLQAAIKGTNPKHRPEILRACGELENQRFPPSPMSSLRTPDERSDP